MAQYYCLIAGLVDYGFDTDKKSLNWDSLREEIMDNVTKKDRAKLELLMGLYDVRNIIACAASSGEWRYSPMGTLSQKSVETITPLLTKSEQYDEEEHSELEMPSFIAKALKLITDSEWAEEQEIEVTDNLNTLLYTLYFEETERSGKGFVRDWSRVEQNIRNITAAFQSRKMGIEQSKYIIGTTPTSEQLKSDMSPDFGLKNEITYLEELINILSNNNILKKERDADLLRISLIDDMNTFNYFDISAVMGYYLKIALIDRWASLDPKEGQAIFEKIVKNLSTKDFTEKIAEEK